MEVGLVRSIDIDHEMQQSYLDYAMSVIVARALPDARDGLKPVHRRILYSMFDMGMRPDSDFKKVARLADRWFIKLLLALLVLFAVGIILSTVRG